MPTILETLKNLFRRRRPRSRAEVSGLFRFKYSHFKELLHANTELLNIIADLEDKLQGRRLFGMSYIRSQAARAAFYAFRMAKSLNLLSNHRYPALYDVLAKINDQIKAELAPHRESQAPALVLPFTMISQEMMDWVGGKSANLGEVLNHAHLPIPPGFAITTRAFEVFMTHNDLVDDINKRKMELDPADPASIEQVSNDIQALITAASLPPELSGAILAAYDDMHREMSVTGTGDGTPPRVALRSSAIGEDTELSFAGQYLTLLNLGPDELLAAYQRIVASLYTPRAMAYRLNKGIRDEDLAMGVACLAMVNAVASGVMYSHHPFNILEDKVIINAVWGLGPYAVDGVITPDTYVVGKEDGLPLLSRHISLKPVQLQCHPAGGLRENPVPPELQDQPCLNETQIKTLTEYAIRLEEHFRCPQDIEWALDPHGRLLILQSRPMHREMAAPEALPESPPLPHYPLLLDQGAVAYPGVGIGPVVQVTSDDDLLNFPEGAVLVAPHSSPKFVLVMPKAAAIVTDAGSVTGHMASLAREFAVPTLLGTGIATKVLTPGEVVTVDAHTGRVYQGQVPELAARRQPRAPQMQDTPVFQTLKKVADLIVPLKLVDPNAPDFTPENCRTLHDISRLVHEFSYKEMFTLSDLVSDTGVGALKVVAPVRLDLYVIDLGGGVSEEVPDDAVKVTIHQITSVPLLALLRGLLHKDLQYLEPRPIEFSGLLSVMREQMLSPTAMADRFGDRSYAIISDRYLNFSSRVGYHYSILDCWCGQTVNKNYITFSFKGGAADDVRRHRRARAIALMLVGLGFTVDVKGDQVDARLYKHERPVIENALDQVGRLLQFTRQMDMLMVTDASIEVVAQNFLAGNYRLEFAPPKEASQL